MEESFSDKHWSMSIGTLQRMDTQLRRINTIKMDYSNLDLGLYATSLGVLYDEVHPFLKQQEHKDQAEKLWVDLTETYQKYSHKSGIRKVGGKALFSACNALNLFLRDMMYEYDLLMNKPDEGWEDRF